MGWHLLETLLHQVGEHSTLVGKLWVTATFIFRFVIVASVGDAVYSDEQSDFTCNTNQPGCENVCFNLFSPISHLRFWAAQIIAVCTPSIVFIVFATHVLLKSQQDSEGLDGDEDLDEIEDEVLPPEPQTRSPRKRKAPGRMPSSRSRRSARPMRPRPEIGMVRGFANPPGEATEIVEEIKEDESEEENPDNNESAAADDDDKSLSEINREIELLEKMEEDDDKTSKKQIQFTYVITLLLRTGFEAVFLWLQYILYGFEVPELFQCERFPCPNIVDCFVSRPKEKTLFLWFMFVVSCICLFLNIVEIHYLGLKKLFKILCAEGCCGDSRTDDDVFESRDSNDFPNNENTSKASKKSFVNNEDEIRPSAPPAENPIYTVVDYSDDKNKQEDPIGFENIGNQPPYAMPGYPYVHRYGMYLNATPPPPPQPREPEKYYL